MSTASRRPADHFPAAGRQHHRHGGPHPRGAAVAEGLDARGIDLTVVLDRTTTIRASVHDVERTLADLDRPGDPGGVSSFCATSRATLIPSVAVPVSLVGTFGVMYLCGYSLDNLSLMALTISTGFVVDDAIVVIENITRYLEKGMTPMQAALHGAQEIGFTVLSISISLVAVFIPILLMGGIVGRLFREFAVTLSVAILVSLVVSLTTTPMMCARLLKHEREEEHGRLYRASEKGVQLDAATSTSAALRWVLRHPAFTLVDPAGHHRRECLSVRHRAQGIFPAAGHGTIDGGIQGVAGHFVSGHASS